MLCLIFKQFKQMPLAIFNTFHLGIDLKLEQIGDFAGKRPGWHHTQSISLNRLYEIKCHK